MQSAQFALHAAIEESHWWFVARRQVMLSVVRQLLPPAEDKRAAGDDREARATVIDIGCGTGANIAALAGDYRAVGIDTSADAIHFAAERFPEVDFRAGLAPDDLSDCLPQAKLVMMMDVLEHVPDDFALLSSILAAAAEGTYFLLTVPADLSLWSPHDEAFGHYRRYDVERFRQLWQELPVEEQLVAPLNTRLYPLIRLVRALNRRRRNSTGDSGTDFHIPARWTNAALQAIFAGERHAILRQLARGQSDLAAGEPASRPRGVGRRGVSLMAVLQRGSGPIALRQKPATLADHFDPECGQLVAAGV
ncbi:MAG: class I SAM-dependent methyltransferase [Planctomycetota bacterium]|nr:MAG: class I SAM-dependent methyltransferase [Planctomycetota bacterium]REJ97859.1 MAG: class I SAM-dependent methyltransferase [Planctomycetota bacterium]REK18374.1 MAG: class I SAM-dependent methyltransferase [Planctomycetota bacterium]REK40451.1 MAG: class I SAM-dependent methyltransferase [Planctomycetota bacterium]